MFRKANLVRAKVVSLILLPPLGRYHMWLLVHAVSQAQYYLDVDTLCPFGFWYDNFFNVCIVFWFKLYAASKIPIETLIIIMHIWCRELVALTLSFFNSHISSCLIWKKYFFENYLTYYWLIIMYDFDDRYATTNVVQYHTHKYAAK